ncbi:MAG TPA: type II secretion system protein GspG [Kiritimatiellia bacterium]|nr:type II secretion system protein GspG [Kiritimatiellia bacterium]HRU70410.1 type II secretion system protein GspG [Kiritimatiellia bacterium]
MKTLNERQMRRRAVERIRRECEQQKAELRAPAVFGMWRSPRMYLVIIAGLALIGGLLFRASDRAAQRNVEPSHLRAMRHVDVLAEALGRYRFHVGAFPNAEQGLAALVRDPQVPRWNGPYINQLRRDPWGTPYVYEPASNGLPLVLSCGADRMRGTADDILPDPARFDPGTAWTNGWLPAAERYRPGVTVLPSPTK